MAILEAPFSLGNRKDFLGWSGEVLQIGSPRLLGSLCETSGKTSLELLLLFVLEYLGGRGLVGRCECK